MDKLHAASLQQLEDEIVTDAFNPVMDGVERQVEFAFASGRRPWSAWPDDARRNFRRLLHRKLFGTLKAA